MAENSEGIPGGQSKPSLLPMLWGILAIVGTAGLLLAFASVMTTRRAKVNSQICRANLRQIWIAADLYADDNGGAFPQSFLQLYQENYTDNPKMFSCPAKPSRYKEFSLPGGVADESTSYVYLPGRFTELPGDFILIHDKPANHGGDGINILRVDGTALWVAKRDVPTLLKEIADQEAQLPELRRKWEEQKKASQKPNPGSAESPGRGP